ncbi:MAG: hypothetical protein DI622_13050 [Chryseobacterium sp.]|nr:MAG: hypothetical protein DI622_13050 [Chryseobacterium sp.]
MLLGLMNVMYAQTEILEKYPYGQDFYVGGLNGLNKEMRTVLKENKLKPCVNDEEKYLVSVLVNPDKTIQFVKDFDTINIEKNKCAYNLSKKILRYLKNWIPAKVNEGNVKAIASFTVNPYFLFNNKVKKIYGNKDIEPVFERGASSFQREVKKILESYIKENINSRKISIMFVINENGMFENLRILNLQIDEITEKDLIKDILSIKGKWTPGTRNGMPIRYNMHLYFEQEFSFEVEKEKMDNQQKVFQRY